MGDYTGKAMAFEDYKAQNKALKMEEKLMKKRMALDRKISEAQRYKTNQEEIGVPLKPIATGSSSSTRVTVSRTSQ